MLAPRPAKLCQVEIIMRRVVLLSFLLSLVSSGSLASTALAQTVTCADFDAWEWAQAAFESELSQYQFLDSDGDGEACPELPRGGLAAAFWTDAIPEDVEEAEVIRVIDGDTFEVLIDGVSNRVRIYRADTPETQNETHCGGAEATAFAEFALSFNDNENGIVFLERDENQRDRHGRELAYIWFEVDGEPYMLNHSLINNGWAEDINYGDELYDEEFQNAAEFAERHQLGVYGLCGAFELPPPQQPALPVLPQPAAPTLPQPAIPAPQEPAPSVPEEPAAPAPGAGCDPNYVPCVPVYPPDVNCGDLGFGVTVVGSDPHGLDRDNDGYGCESYGKSLSPAISR